MASGGFHIRGLSALTSGLGAIDLGGASEGNMVAAATHLKNEIQVRAPVDTGHLKNSYGYVVDGRGENAEAFVGTNTHYAVHQEYGTVHQPGTAHVRPALDANQDQLIQIMAADTLESAFSHL